MRPGANIEFTAAKPEVRIADAPSRGIPRKAAPWTKTSPDPVLSIRRRPWPDASDLACDGVDPAVVGAAFYHVLTDQLRFVDAPVELIDEALEVGT